MHCQISSLLRPLVPPQTFWTFLQELFHSIRGKAEILSKGVQTYSIKSTLIRMKQILLLISLTAAVHVVCGEDEEGRQVRNLNVFNVVSFPNSECAAVSGYNGTCYTASECSSLGGSASGTCASSFGVCCVFSIACGSSSSANNSYAVISSYSTSTDSDPCTYTFCKTNTDVCKLRIDFDTMVLSAPSGVTTPADTAQVYADSVTVGDCTVDSLTVRERPLHSPLQLTGLWSCPFTWSLLLTPTHSGLFS